MDTASLELLAHSVPAPGDVAIEQYAFERNGSFTLSDSKTCRQPRRTEPCPANCNQEILCIHTSEPLTVVGFDNWQQDASDSACDYLIFDSGAAKKKFAFCELTCSKERYVEPREGSSGKRAKAYSQMMETWRLISESENPIFKAQVLNYVDKIGIFGWRDRNIGNPTMATRSMRGFTRTPSSAVGILKFPNYEFGESFDFIQVKYPHEFNWQS